MATAENKAPSQGLIKVKSFFTKAYYIGLCNKDGKLSVAKSLFAAGSLLYFAFINPMMLAAIAEIVIIVGMIMFLVQLFFAPNFIAGASEPAAA